MLKPGSTIATANTQLYARVIAVVSDYVSLTKPPIVLMLLITALGGAFLAAEGAPPATETLLLLLGGAAAAGGAGAVNHYLDRDIDAIMGRTRRRPLPQRRISARNALTMGVGLNVFAFALLAGAVNLPTALLTLAGALFYIVIYTWWLKRTTPQNIVIGGAAGAVPPLAGWTAVTGGLDLQPVYLFAIIFLWTPPHFWALALLIREDYARAGIPMLPVVRGVAATHRGILGYTIALVALCIGCYFALPVLGALYLGASSLLGSILLFLAWRLVSEGPGRGRTWGMNAARLLYLYSLIFLALIFAAIMVDSVVAL